MAILLVTHATEDIRALTKALALKDLPRIQKAQTIGDALSVLANQDELCEPDRIELILINTVMPDLDSIALCRFIKSTEKTQDIPIIMLSAEHQSAELSAAFDAGAHDYIVAPFHPTELSARVRAALRLKREIDQRRARERELEQLSGEDALTRLANRRRFNEILSNEVHSARRRSTLLALLILDVDFFKQYNDFYGHPRGDLCLKMVAQQMKQSLQRATDVAARYGGEEFAVILPDTDMAGAKKVAEDIRRGIEELKIPHARSRVSRVVTVSIGVVVASPATGTTDSHYTASADGQLYIAKEGGRNRVSLTNTLELKGVKAN